MEVNAVMVESHRASSAVSPMAWPDACESTHSVSRLLALMICTIVTYRATLPTMLLVDDVCVACDGHATGLDWWFRLRNRE